MALYNNDGALIEESIGRTVKVESGFSYWGDGDGTYYTRAVVWTGDEFKTIMGESRWNAYDGPTKYDKKNYIDAPEDIVQAYEDKVRAEAAERERKEFNRQAYRVERGRYAIVERGKRGRKNEGRHGIIKWFGNNRYGQSVLIVPEGEEEGFFAPAQYVQVIPDWDDAWVDNTVEA